MIMQTQSENQLDFSTFHHYFVSFVLHAVNAALFALLTIYILRRLLFTVELNNEFESDVLIFIVNEIQFRFKQMSSISESIKEITFFE